MAFSKAPVQDTYSTQEFPFIKELGSRGSDTSKDSYVVNLFYEVSKNELTGENDIFLTKRDGSTQFIAATGSSGEVRGLYHWEDQQRLYVAIEDDIYIYNSSSGASVATLSTVWATSTGNVGFTEFLYETGATKIVAVDGARLVTIDSGNTVATSVSANLPTHEPTPVYVDGYLLLLKTSSADIYNSDLNDPLLWTAGNFITGEMLPDQATKLSRINNYLLLFGKKSIEYFYDAAIPEGSPFQRNDAYVKYTGHLGGISAYGANVFFVGSNNDSQPDVFILSNSEMKPVGNQAIRQHLASLTSFASLVGQVVSLAGNDFYVLDTGTSTYAFNMKTFLWTVWIYQDGTRFAMTNATNTETSSAYRSLFTISGSRAVYKFDPALYQDNGTNFTWTVVTDSEDFDTYNQKFMHRLVMVTDKPTATNTVNVSWTDDDYQNYNTPISLELYQELPCIYRLGRFRRRALKISKASNMPFRLKRIDVDINKGGT